MLAFWILLLVGLIALWFLCSFAFKPIGRFIGKIIKDTKEIITEEEKEKKE